MEREGRGRVVGWFKRKDDDDEEIEDIGGMGRGSALPVAPG